MERVVTGPANATGSPSVRKHFAVRQTNEDKSCVVCTPQLAQDHIRTVDKIRGRISFERLIGVALSDFENLLCCDSLFREKKLSKLRRR